MDIFVESRTPKKPSEGGGEQLTAALSTARSTLTSWWGGAGAATEAEAEAEVAAPATTDAPAPEEGNGAGGDGAGEGTGWGSWFSSTLKSTAESASTLSTAASKHLDVLVEALPSDEQIIGFAKTAAATARLVASDVAKEFVEDGSDSDDGFESMLDELQEKFGATAGAPSDDGIALPWDTIQGDDGAKDEMREKILRLSGDARTFMVDPPVEELGGGFEFDAESAALAQRLRIFDARLRKALRLLVGGGKVAEVDFWRNYLYRLTLVRDEFKLREWADALAEGGSGGRGGSGSGGNGSGDGGASGTPTTAEGVAVRFATPDLAALERTVSGAAAQRDEREAEALGMDAFASDEPCFGTSALRGALELDGGAAGAEAEAALDADDIDSLLAGVEAENAAAAVPAVAAEEDVDVDSLLADIAAESGGGGGAEEDDLDVDALLAETEA